MDNNYLNDFIHTYYYTVRENSVVFMFYDYGGKRGKLDDRSL